jgi:hypothetical protein
MSPLDDALRFAGFVLAHAVWAISDLEAGELLCPIGVVECGDSREIIPFEAPSQEEAIKLGKKKMIELTSTVDRWAFAREGLSSILGSNSPKEDVVSVSAWSAGLDEPITLQQAFSPKSKEGFALIGAVEIVIHGTKCTEQIQSKLLPIISRGIAQHPHGEGWRKWHSERA